MKQLHVAAAIVMILFASCKKDVNENNDNRPYDPVNVLNDNSGFEHVWDTTMFMQTFGRYGMSDMTIENDHLLHFVFIENSIEGVYGYESFHRRSVYLTEVMGKVQ